MEVVAYTQAAAQGIRGTTIHGLLKISCNKNNMDRLSAKSLSELQERLKDTQLIVYDEYSIPKIFS